MSTMRQKMKKKKSALRGFLKKKRLTDIYIYRSYIGPVLGCTQLIVLSSSSFCTTHIVRQPLYAEKGRPIDAMKNLCV